MKKGSIIVVGLVVMSTPMYVWSMAQSQHQMGMGDLGGIRDLIGSPASQGGIGDMPIQRIESINRWMDNPATRTGQMKNQMAGGETLTPRNHRFQRHNPAKVANAFAGRGTPDPSVMNVARLHKIQDVAIGTSAVDGHPITPAMKKQAETILRYVRRYKLLPQEHRLPAWVDDAGPLMRGGKAGPTTAALKSSPAAAASRVGLKAGSANGAHFVHNPHPRTSGGRFPHPRNTSPVARPRQLPVAARIAGPVIVTALMAREAYKTETAYVDGAISSEERTVLHGVTVAATSCGYGGAIAGAKAGALGGSVFGPAGTVIGGVAGGVVGGLMAAYGGQYVAGAVGDQWMDGQHDQQEIYQGSITEISSPIEM